MHEVGLKAQPGESLAIVLMAALAITAFVVAWRRDNAVLTVAWTWFGLIVLATIDMAVVYFVTGFVSVDAPATVFKFIIIGWAPGLAIHGLAGFVRHFFFWDGK